MRSTSSAYSGDRALFYDHVATGVDGDVAFYVGEARAAGRRSWSWAAGRAGSSSRRPRPDSTW